MVCAAAPNFRSVMQFAASPDVYLVYQIHIAGSKRL